VGGRRRRLRAVSAAATGEVPESDEDIAVSEDEVPALIAEIALAATAHVRDKMRRQRGQEPPEETN
jgi:hypothetical protein